MVSANWWCLPIGGVCQSQVLCRTNKQVLAGQGVEYVVYVVAMAPVLRYSQCNAYPHLCMH